MEIRLMLGDCLERMAEIPDGSVDAIITDPPYGTGQWKRPEAGAGKDQRASHSVEEWDVWDQSWFNDAMRICRGPIVFFMPITRVEGVLEYARDHSLTWRLLFWCKSDPRPRFTGQLAHGYEPIMVFRPVLKGETDWIEASSPRLNRDHEATGHPHQKPLKVVTWLCEMVCDQGETIADPFMGSGTTGAACAFTERNFIGIESDPGYFTSAQLRIEQAQVGRCLSTRNHKVETAAPGQTSLF